MIEIWQECASFQTANQRIAHQVRRIIKKGWFSDLEIQEIYQKINNGQNSNTVPDTSGINNEKQPNRNEPPNSENKSTTQLQNTELNNLDQTLTQEQNVNLENLKRIMISEKTTLQTLRNIEWRTVNTEKNR